ncbi:uncharacterized protein LOC131357957 [Hemibagrus wyckioides]|uniref:uncharacterized protein LOC131357957 n=1 Tax=Hemibagrus wyckioides TaxID=337641 RepID=UPI00266B6100|nr:uncharacterized protein LOC131357957 [Hemibagrus wyckioides]
MTGFWILILIFITMYTIHPHRSWVTAQSLQVSEADQPDKELSVNIGDSATLRCCASKKQTIVWYKQPNKEKPQILVTVYKDNKETFHTGFQKSNFRIERSSNCINMIILNIIQSDEAMYYCAVMRPNLVFGDGTYLKIKGKYVNISSETSKPVVSDNSVVSEPTLHGNNTNMNTQDKTENIRSVIGLGTALGLCSLLIFCLTYYILKKRKSNTSIEESPGTWQESEAESLNYAALQFSKRKAKGEKKKTLSSEECVYSDVKKTAR